MAIHELNVAGYRSIRTLRLRLGRINVLTGPNGCGKSNLYQSMFLLAAAPAGQLARSIALEGGMPSVLWAGERRKQEAVRFTLGAEIDNLRYDIACGLPTPTSGATREEPTLFGLDPEVKSETIHFLEKRKSLPMMERDLNNVWARDSQGVRVSYPFEIMPSESALAQLREPHKYPHLSALRFEILSWRFYHYFRTDAEAPQRHPQVGVRTPILSHDGRDLAAAIQTIYEIGARSDFLEAVDNAFPGARVKVKADDGRFRIEMKMPGILRAFDARELSDGTLRYLCLLTALLSPRAPTVLALNEPETSLHPDLLDPLARLIVRAAEHSQLWITTHSLPLARAIEEHSGMAPIELEKVGGETRIVGQGLLDR